MGITVKHGKIGDIARLGVLAGKSEAAQKAIARAQAVEDQLRQIEHNKEMAQFRAQLDIEASKRSMQWQLEKMEIASRTDFAREEARRQQKLSEKQSKLDALDRAYKNGQITEEDYHNAYVQTESEVPFYAYAKQAERAEAKQDPVKQYISRLLAEGQPGTTGRIKVVSPQGQSGTIESGEWPLYQAQGFRRAS